MEERGAWPSASSLFHLCQCIILEKSVCEPQVGCRPLQAGRVFDAYEEFHTNMELCGSVSHAKALLHLRFVKVPRSHLNTLFSHSVLNARQQERMSAATFSGSEKKFSEQTGGKQKGENFCESNIK